MHWGKGKGCDFVTDKCLTPSSGGSGVPAAPFPRHFCADPSGGSGVPTDGCTLERKFKGICGFSTWSADLPAPFQYFTSDAAKGGRVKEADYCPYYDTYNNGDCRVAANAATNNYLGESFGSSSRCFDSSLKQTHEEMRVMKANEVEVLRSHNALREHLLVLEVGALGR